MSFSWTSLAKSSFTRSMLVLLHVATAVVLLSSCNQKGSTITDNFLGGIALSTSATDLSVASPTVASGLTVLVTLSAKDQNGHSFYVPHSEPVVAFSASGGTSTGSFGAVTNNHDGTYTSVFTAINSGTNTTISATIDGIHVKTTATVRVISGSYSLSQSYVTLSSPSIISGATATATLHMLDNSGNPLAVGGFPVTFQISGGLSTATLSAVTDNGDGTYSVTLTGVHAGSATSVTAQIEGSSITSAHPSIAVLPGAPTTILISSGNNQSAVVATMLSNPMVAIVKDASGNPTPNVVVDWGTSSGNLLNGSVTTNASGLSSNTLTLSSTSGSTAVTATVQSTALSLTFTETAVPGSTGSLVWQTAPALSYTASNSSAMTTFSAKLLDSQGNLRTSDNTTTVTLTLIQGNGALAGTLTKTALSGVVTFSDIVYTKAETIKIRAVENVSSHSVDSGSVIVSPNAISTLTSTIQAAASTVSSDGVTPVNVTITLKDAFGNPISGVSTQFASTGSGNSITQPSASTDSSGQATGSMSSTVAETKTLSVSIPAGMTSVTTTLTFAATAVVAANSTITASGPIVADGASTLPVTVTLRDINSNPVSGVTPSFAGTGTGNTYGTCTSTNASGVSTCSMTSTKAESKTLSITGPVAKSGSSVSFVAGAASQLSWTTQPSDGSAGSPLATQGVVTIQDANGNTVLTGVDSTANIALTLQSGSGVLLGTISLAAVGGVANFSGLGLQINLIGSKVILATKSSTIGSGGTGVISKAASSLTISPSAATTLAVTGFPISVTAGQGYALSVTALDAYGNTDSGFSGTVHFTSSDIQGVLPSDYTFTTGSTSDNGAHFFTGAWAFRTSGAQSVTATDTVTSSITGSDSNVIVYASAADHLVKIAGDAQTQSVGALLSVSPQVKVVDLYGNVVAGTSLTFTPSTGSIGSSPQASDSSGLASSTWTLGTTPGAQTLTVARLTTALPGTPASVTFNETAQVGLANATTTTIQVSSPTTVADGNTPVNVTITLLDQYSNPISGSAATFASTGTGNTLTQPSGTTNASGVLVGSIKTTVPEAKTLSIASPAGLSSDTATLTAASPTLSIAGTSANEGSNLSFTVTLSTASTQSVTVGYASSNGTALSGTNYNATSGTLTIPAGQTSGTITVPTTDDTVYNVALNMSMTLSSPTNATIATSVGTGTINNIDSQPSILINDVTANEGSADNFTVSLSNASYQPISVAYATSNGTAIAGANYTVKSGTLTIPAGSTSGTVSVTTNDDGVYAATGLTFNLNLTSPTNATIADNLGIGTVTNVDSAPNVQFTASTQSVNQSPSTQTVTVTAQLSAAANSNTAVNVPLTLTGTAASGTDYTISPTSITIAGGSTTGTTTLTITNSGTPGADKIAILTMGTPTNAALGPATAQTVTIVNNNYPSVNFSVATQDVAINQGTATVNVTLSTAPTKTVTVPITISGSSSAVANTDYTLTAPTLTFTSGVTSQSFTYTILDQASPATANATLILGLGSITNGSAGGTATQTSTIRSPSLDLNFAAMYDPVNQMSQAPYNQITFTRASTATYMDCDGVIKTAAVNVPRIDCNPTTGQPNGLLIEESRTNLALQSQAQQNAANWSSIFATVKTNSAKTVAPDGTFTSMSLVEDTTANNYHYLYQYINVISGTNYCASGYLKSNGDTYASVQLGGFAFPGNQNISVNLINGNISSQGSGSITSYGSLAAGNGWYRVHVCGAATSTNPGAPLFMLAGNAGNPSYSGNGVSGIYIWGAQFEAGAFPTSYIPTTTAAITRAADLATSASSSWYNSSYATLYSDYFANPAQNNGNNQIALQLDDVNAGGLNSNRFTLFTGTALTPAFKEVSGNTTNASLTSATAISGTGALRVRIAGAAQVNDFAAAISTSPSTTLIANSGAMPVGVSLLTIGGQNGAGQIDGAISRISYFARRLSNAYLQQAASTSNYFRTYTPTANLTLTSQTAIEPQGTVYITAALSEPAASAVTLPYTVGGTAVSGTNYTGLASGNFTFSAGQSRSTISFNLKDDGTSTNPTITVTLGSGTGYSLGTQTAQTITIQRPSLDLNFAAMYNPAAQNSTSPYNAITFTRASTASYMDATGLIAYSANNIPRIDYNPVTHQSNGLLIEESRTNSLTYSSAIGGTGWSLVTSATASMNSTVATDGTSTASTLIDGNSSGYSYVSESPSCSNSQTWTASTYLKKTTGVPASFPFIRLNFGGGTTALSFDTWLNTTTGAIVAGSSATTSTIGVQDSGNYWRIWVTGTNNATGNNLVSIQIYPAGGTTIGTGSASATGSITAWGAQLEQGAFPTSYIPTTTTAVTRAAENMSTSSLSWLNTSLGTFRIGGQTEYSTVSTGAFPSWLNLWNNSSNAIQLYNYSATSNVTWQTVTSGTYKTVTDGTISANTPLTLATAYNSNDLAAANNGVSATPVTTATIPSGIATFYLGSVNAGNYLNGAINRVSYYPQRLSDQQLQILSNPNQYSPRLNTPTVTLRTASQSILQSSGQAFFVGVLSQPASSAITVPYTISGTAVIGTDYSGVASGTMTFNAGQSIATTSFTVLTTASTNKTVIMTLGTPTGATLGTYSAETIYLTNATTGLTLTSSTVSNSGSTVTFSGTCGPGEIITISGQQSATTTCSAGGTWTWTSSTISTDGSYLFNFTQADGINSGTTVAGTYNRDTTLPNAVATFLDGNTTSSLTTSPIMTWSASTDSGSGASGIAYYLVALGTTAGGTDIVGYTNVGNTALYQFTGLSLANGTMYFGSIKAVDSAGNISTVTQGDGFAVVTDSPTLGLNFTNSTTIANGAALTSTSTSYPAMVQFSRAGGSNASPGMYYNSAGVLTGASQNGVLYSQDFSQSNWVKNGATVPTSPLSQAPDGTLTAQTLTESAITSSHAVQESSIPYSAGTTIATSVYVKPSGQNYIRITLSNGTDGVYCQFNLTNSSYAACNTGGTAVFVSAAVQNLPNGWFRLVLISTPSTSSSSLTLYLTLVNTPAGSASYLGTAGIGVMIWGAQLEVGSTPSSYIYTTSAPAYGPRFDYNPTQANCPGSACSLRGLLIEESRANSNKYSGDLSNAAWFIGNSATASANTAVAPDGTNTATTLSDTTTASQSYIRQSFTVSDSQSWVASLYILKDTDTTRYPAIQLAFTGGTTSVGATAYLNTLNGNVVSPEGATVGVQDVGNYWRVWVLGTNNASGNNNLKIWIYPALGTSSGSLNVAATGSIVAWGAQLEQGAMPTSYIPTTSTAMTRSADIATITGMGFLGINQGTLVASAMSGALYLNSTALTAIVAQQIAASLETDLNNRIQLRRSGANTTSGDGTINTLYSGSGTASINSGGGNGSWPQLSVSTLGLGYASGSLISTGGGSTIATSSTANLFTPTQLGVGRSSYYGTYFNGWIQSINYYNTRLSNSAILELTHP